MARIKVVVGDKERLLAEALRVALSRYDDLEVYQLEAPPGRTVTGLGVAFKVSEFKPDVAVLDYWIGGMTGSALVQAMRAWAPSTKVILLAWFHGALQVKAAVDAGAAALLSKGCDIEELVDAIRRTHAGEHPVFPEKLVEALATAHRGAEEYADRSHLLATLTRREVQILYVLSGGRPNREVAQLLAIEPGTLRIHIQNIMRKLGATSKFDVIAMARLEGLIQA